MANFKPSLREVVRKRLKSKGLTHEKLAKQFNVDVESVRAVLYNKKQKSESLKNKICEHLGIKEDDYDPLAINAKNKKSKKSIGQPVLVIPTKRSPLTSFFSITVTIVALLIVSYLFFARNFSGDLLLYPISAEGEKEEFLILTGADGRKIENGGIVKAGEPITVLFALQNPHQKKVITTFVLLGGRGPGVNEAGDNGWDAPEVLFEQDFYLWLAPGTIAYYEDTRPIFQPGDYFVEPLYADIRTWHGVHPYTRIYFKVVP